MSRLPLLTTLGATLALSQPMVPTLRAEAGPTAPFTTAQAQRFASGWSFSGTGSWEVHPAIDIEVAVIGSNLTALEAPAKRPLGAMAALLTGARFRRPGVDTLVRPWVAASLGGAWSGAVSFAASASVGVSTRPTERFPVWVGLVLRVDVLAAPTPPLGSTGREAVLGAVLMTLEWQPRPSSREEVSP